MKFLVNISYTSTINIHWLIKKVPDDCIEMFHMYGPFENKVVLCFKKN
jgi:hypothetical protein